MNKRLLRRRATMDMKSGDGSDVATHINVLFAIPRTIIAMDTGIALTNASWYASDYITIPTNATAIIYNNEKSSTVNYRGAFYDIDNVYISSELTNIWAIAAGKSVAINIPANARYIRLSTNATSIFAETEQFQMAY